MPEQRPARPTFAVDFEPVGRRSQASRDESILSAARSAGVELVSLCGGAGLCDSCVVRLVRGELSSPSAEEQAALSPQELADGYRLACQTFPLSDVKIEIPPESLGTPQRLQVEGQEVAVEADPVIRVVDVRLEPASLTDLRSDAARVRDALGEVGISLGRLSLPLLSRLSDQLRAQDWSARLAVRGDQWVAVMPVESRAAGLAVDVGTTKLAGYLIDLVTGERLAMMGAMNPQISYGEDVISRIAYANDHPEGRQTLQRKLVDTLNRMIVDMAAEAGVTPEQIVEAVVVGNTAMHHLALGLPVRQLALAPYVPAVSEALHVPAIELGLHIAPGAFVYLPPNIAGFVGADHVAMVLATDVWKTERTVMAIDIGTNTEITLASKGRLLCCSCASGPAFEGAHIQDGMRAAPGAIERLQIGGGKVRTYTIGNQAPVGLCGSGILDAVAEMLRNGLIDARGALQDVSSRARQSERGLVREFVLVPASDSGHGKDVVVTRSDVHEIQLAKGAIRSGIEILLGEAGINSRALDEFIVAGAFGTYLDVRSAVRIGMFPDLPPERFRQVGNAAGTGARQMLVSAERRRAAAEIVRREAYIELTTHPGFEKVFMQALHF